MKNSFLKMKLPRIIFLLLNYSKKNNTETKENSDIQTQSENQHMVSTTEFPLLKA